MYATRTLLPDGKRCFAVAKTMCAQGATMLHYVQISVTLTRCISQNADEILQLRFTPFRMTFIYSRNVPQFRFPHSLRGIVHLRLPRWQMPSLMQHLGGLPCSPPTPQRICNSSGNPNGSGSLRDSHCVREGERSSARPHTACLVFRKPTCSAPISALILSNSLENY